MTAAAALACHAAAVPMIRVRMTRAQSDSTAYSLPAAVHRCRGGGALVSGAEGAYGVLAWVRAPGGVTPGAYPLLGRADSTTPRGALVAVRFLTHEIAHGFQVDSGTLTLTAAGASFSGRIEGRGLDAAFATRTQVTIVIDPVAPKADSVACGAAPS